MTIFKYLKMMYKAIVWYFDRIFNYEKYVNQLTDKFEEVDYGKERRNSHGAYSGYSGGGDLLYNGQ